MKRLREEDRAAIEALLIDYDPRWSQPTDWVCAMICFGLPILMLATALALRLLA